MKRREAYLVSLATTLAMSLSYVDRQVLSVLAPTITKALGISDVAYGWLGSGFALAYLAAGPLAGVLIDRIGARRGLLGGVLLWSLVAALHALAPSFAVLFALRLALGVAESPTFPGGVQVVQRGLPPADRARGMSLLFIGMSLGGMLAPPIAIGIATRFGWRAAFVGTALLALVWAPSWIAITSRARVKAALDGGDRVDPSGKVSRARLREVVRHPAMLRGLAGLLAIVPASAFALAWEAKFYTRQFALPQASLAPYLVASAVAYDVGALVFGDLASRRAAKTQDSEASPRLLLALGALLAITGLAGLAFASDPHVALAFFVASGAGRGAVVTVCNTDALARIPLRAVSAAGGVIASVQSLGGLITNPLLGNAVQHLGYRPALLALAAWTVPGVLLWLIWRSAPHFAGRSPPHPP